MANSRRSTMAWGALFGFFCLLMLVVGLETALHFLGPPIDGPFQLYNAVRRIMAGQRPGVDFQFFHGVLIPYLHYPLFRALGGGFIASEISRQLVSAILYPLTIVVVLKFFLRDWTRTLAWAAIVMMASIGLRMTSVLVAVNSLLGIRSTLPALMPVVLCLPLRRRYRVAIGALTIGGALLLGTEQGLALIGALLIAGTVLVLRARRGAEAIDLAAMIGGGVITLLMVLVMLGGFSGMRSAVAYNFRIVPLDQYWYFGSPPNIFLSSWGMVPAMLASIWRIPVAIAVGIALSVYYLDRTWRSADATRQRRDFAFAVMTLYGALSCASLLGIFVNAYLQPLLRVLLVVIAIELAESLPRRDAALGRPLRAGVGRSTVGVAVATFLIMLTIVNSVLTTTFVTLPHSIRDHLVRREGAVYAGIWPATLPQSQAIFDRYRSPSGAPPVIWSTYAGLLEARNGIFHPSVDYIIHALGPAGRDKYLEDFRRVKPTLVQTVSPTFTQYETWIESTSWDFYTELLRNYRVVGETPWSIFWERLPAEDPAPRLAWSADIAPGTDVVQLPPINGRSDQTALLQVELDYEVHNPLRALPVVGAMPRYLVHTRDALVRDPVSLDPYVTRSRFPMVVRGGARPALHWQVYGLLPGASITVKRISVYLVPITPGAEPWYRAVVAAQSSAMSQ